MNGEQSHLKTLLHLALVMPGREVVTQGGYIYSVESFPRPSRAHFTTLVTSSDLSRLHGNGKDLRPKRGHQLEVAIA